MDILNIFSAFGLSASAGLNAYIPLLIVALMGRFTNLFQLSEPWDALTSWWAIGVLAVLSVVEFFADKVPAANHVNDAIQTFVRPAAGAILFAASTKTVTGMDPILAVVLGILVAGGVHTVKSAAVRPVVTATTAGAGNIPISIAEDVISTVVSIVAVAVPVLLGAILIFFALWILWWINRRSQRRART